MLRKDFARRKFQWLLAFLIGFVPFGALKRWLYRRCFHYTIAPSAFIGFGTLLLVDHAEIGAAHIGWFNTFRGPYNLQIHDGASIETHNAFLCGAWVYDERRQNAGYLRKCVIGHDTLITDRHFIDTVGGFELGDRSWIAGLQSQFWTHGAGVTDRSIVIGADCYIASAVRFAPGTTVGDHSLVAMGSVVTRKFTAPHLLIAGVPADIVKENYNWRNHTTLNDAAPAESDPSDPSAL